ncbi:Nif-specific regulatory protein [Solimonas aquatica]|uniref:Nif-specific regulatory protein n=1 Tax=Solimonas aquatica TaxID=489703 RepID=A0A1H9IPQ7_9GAMM|nr:nif-specific transcriptional activator NifA [Solimonas aquatica]SEQ76574.1 Nif-specific regulatory protein [Solimonas aquatica]
MSSSAQVVSRDHVELVTVYEIGKLLSSSLDIDRTFRVALNVLSVHMGFNRTMIVLAQEDGLLRLHSALGMTQEQIRRAQWASGEGVTGRVYARGVPIVVPDISTEPAFLDRTGAFGGESGGRNAFIAVPIKTHDETLGVLVGQRVVGANLRLNDDLRLLTMVAGLMAQALVLNRNVTEEHARLRDETRRLQKEVRRRYTIDNVVGVSKPMQEVFAEVHMVAPSRSTVLIRGESGTGKEAIARALHYLSPRKSAPFVTVNCAALSESLLESELFGHEKGAFTGASSERKGRFEMANGGTLFLDEIGDISPAFQAKLLRILQEREFERVGGSRPIKVDVRLVCATNRNLEGMIRRGEFRADLYYRINVVSIFLPPLRERREDIPPLVQHFITRFNRENRRELKISKEAIAVLMNCYWPGNVRELENCIERTATMTRGELIDAPSFPCQNSRCLTQMLHHVDKEDAVAAVAERAVPSISVPIPPVPKRVSSEPPPENEEPLQVGPTAHLPNVPERQFGNEAPPQDQRERLIWALEQCGWVQAKAARLLRVTPRQLAYALQKYNIEVRKF